jgi:hypothetical protein
MRTPVAQPENLRYELTGHQSSPGGHLGAARSQKLVGCLRECYPLDARFWRERTYAIIPAL